MAVFAQVVEAGSLSAAARALRLTPSAVSRSIARTEQRLGTRLLLRTTRAITLTAEGEAYLRAARRILADLAEVEDAIADQGVPRGRLRVSAALGHGRMTMVPLVAAFSARYPDIVVDLALGDEVVDILANDLRRLQPGMRGSKHDVVERARTGVRRANPSGLHSHRGPPLTAAT